MAKKSIIARERRKGLMVEKYRNRRAEIKEAIRTSDDYDVIAANQLKLAKLPLNSCAARHSTRCQQCGRAHAIYRKFGLCRICLRQQLMFGNVAGGRKSSW